MLSLVFKNHQIAVGVVLAIVIDMMHDMLAERSTERLRRNYPMQSLAATRRTKNGAVDVALPI